MASVVVLFDCIIYSFSPNLLTTIGLLSTLPSYNYFPATLTNYTIPIQDSNNHHHHHLHNDQASHSPPRRAHGALQPHRHGPNDPLPR
jgi:hypothetical protein